MAFEVVGPAEFKFANALASGECSISKAGWLALLVEDLELVGIDRDARRAIALADSGSLRVAVRAFRNGEGLESMAVGTVRSKKGADRGRRVLNIARAIRRCALEPEQVVGRYPLNVKGDAGGMLIINLTGEKLDDGKGPKT